MLLSTVQQVHDEPVKAGSGKLPPEIMRLFPREQELSKIVFDRKLVTANDVQRSASAPLSNAAVRTILNRLVAKGILARQQCAGRRLFLYAPALTESLSLVIATRKLCDDFCEGSLRLLANELADQLASSTRPSPALPAGTQMPQEIAGLARGRREIATIIYEMGGATIREIQARRAVKRTAESVRSSVYDLARRGIVTRRRTGRQGEYLYLPAIVTAEVTRVAVRKWLRDRFNGSPAAGLQFVHQLIQANEVRTSL